MQTNDFPLGGCNERFKDMVELAEGTIESTTRRTPLCYSNFFSQYVNGSVYMKLENQQVTHSFKIRGACNKICHLTEGEKDRGVVTASSGNHGLAIAKLSEEMNLHATIFVPKDTPQKKIDKMSDCGVSAKLCGEVYDEAEQEAFKYADENNLVYLSSYNDPLVVAGQGTVGLEIIKELPKVDVILVPVGGGSLISGVATVTKNTEGDINVIGVQSEASPVMYESLNKGKIVDLTVSDSIADGLSGGLVEGAITFDIAKDLVDEMVLVGEQTIKKAIRMLWEKEGQIVEGAGAVGLAAIIEDAERFRNSKTVAVITGGNIDESLFTEVTHS